MDRDKLLRDVAPCSLSCYTCPGYKDGVIAKLSSQLLNYHKGCYDFECQTLPRKYHKYAKNTLSFVNNLESKANAPCNGCRQGGNKSCCIPGCIIPECVKAHGVDFCGECPDFPCTRVDGILKGIVLDDWRAGSARIKEIGAEQYHGEVTARGHYSSWEKK